MYGPIELFSHAAVQIFFDGLEDCKSQIHIGTNTWEEIFITKCLNLLGVEMNPWMNLNLLSDPHCQEHLTEPDCSGDAVAMHKVDTVEDYMKCWNEAHESEVDASAT